MALESNEDWKSLPKTWAVVNGILERVHLLLHVTIMPEGGVGPFGRTVSLYHQKSGTDLLNDFPL